MIDRQGCMRNLPADFAGPVCWRAFVPGPVAQQRVPPGFAWLAADSGQLLPRSRTTIRLSGTGAPPGRGRRISGGSMWGRSVLAGASQCWRLSVGAVNAAPKLTPWRRGDTGPVFRRRRQVPVLCLFRRPAASQATSWLSMVREGLRFDSVRGLCRSRSSFEYITEYFRA